jgi:hypothetical protein
MPETVEDHIAYYTQKAGDLTRQLGLAGIGVIWLFRFTTTSGLTIPTEFSLPAALIVLSLALDLTQYLVGISFWGDVWLRRGGGADKVSAHPNVVILMLAIVTVKVVAMLLAYCVLLCRLLEFVRFAPATQP